MLIILSECHWTTVQRLQSRNVIQSASVGSNDDSNHACNASFTISKWPNFKCVLIGADKYTIILVITLKTRKQHPDSWSPTTEFAICIWYSLLPFYQTLLYLHAYEFELQSLQFLSYIANFNFFMFNIAALKDSSFVTYCKIIIEMMHV